MVKSKNIKIKKSKITKSKIKKNKKTKNTKKTKKNKILSTKSSTKSLTKSSSKSSKQSSSMASLLDFTKSKSLTSLSKSSDIKSTTSVGDFYNLIDTYDTINQNCINKVKDKFVDGIKLNKKVAKDVCSCLFEKNKDLTIDELEKKTKDKMHTPGSSCISIIDKFINNEKHKKSSKSYKTYKSTKLSKY